MPFALCLGLFAAGCNDGDGVDDYTPPEGFGALTIDNNTPTDLDVFIDGRASPRVKDGDIRRYNLSPGVHRIILRDDERIYDTWAADVDILERRQTILDVDTESLGDDFDVGVFLD
jgi:hypothetical protein